MAKAVVKFRVLDSEHVPSEVSVEEGLPVE